ncbi:MAG TPA: hypothetical protein VEQ58_01565 [Polyangiaceae bacterium]|nr:hypothetical protein [Polyangiaceae bacterium]
MPEVLARVTSRAVEGPRGPDVLHRIKVLGEWLAAGEVIELELPRNLACAACGGGGCDTCGRSGAITLRQRDELAEVLEVTLPVRAAAELPSAQGLTLRIPEQGGLPEPGSDLPRGLLLLTVVPSAEPDPRIKVLRGVVSKQPPASIVLDDEAAAEGEEGLERPRKSPLLVVAIVLVALWILFLIWLRLSGQS